MSGNNIPEIIVTTLDIGYSIEKVSCFQKQQNILDEVFKTIEGSYQTFSFDERFLGKEFKLCTDIYLVQDYEQKIVAFFMVGLQQIGERLFYYLGLSVCKPEYKNKGIGAALYKQFANDCKKIEDAKGYRIPCYWTTATPIAYHWFCKHFNGVQPGLNGSCSDEAKKWISKIAKSNYPDATFDSVTPFVLRHVASNFLYSSDEQRRIEEAKVKLNTTVFEKYSIDEAKGDRFLMIGFAP